MLFATHNYQFQDPIGGVNAGTIVYRIRQIVDTSAAGFAADYIDTTSVVLSTDCAVITSVIATDSEFDVQLVPNPVKDQLVVKISTPAPIRDLQIRLINSRGQTIQLLKKSKSGGPASFELGVKQIAIGNYYISIYDGNKLVAVKELVKL